jgi:hypothetical protein
MVPCGQANGNTWAASVQAYSTRTKSVLRPQGVGGERVSVPLQMYVTGLRARGVCKHFAFA